MNLSLSDIKEAFYLSNESPSGIKWNLSKYSGKHNHIQSTVQNSNAGSKGKDYWYVMYKETSLLVHRVIFMLANNLESSHVDFVDHEDGNGHNNVLSNLRNSGPKLNSRNKKMSSANQSGTVGVFIITAKGKKYARAQWYNLQGKRCTKNFSYSLHGEAGAWQLAVEVRNKVIEEMQLQGAGYTNRHLGVDNTQ